MPLCIYEDGASSFRQKIVLSVLTGQPVRIKNIRNRSKNPGVSNAEVDFLKLLNELSNGSIVKINDTGCLVSFNPGVLIGGEVSFDCTPTRGIGYFLEPLLLLCSFTKLPLSLLLSGVTNNEIDPSVDVIIQTWLPLIKHFILPTSAAALKLEIKKRGLSPKGGGLVHLMSKPSQKICPIKFISVGKVYRIRGIAWTCRVSPGIASQLVHGAKELLNSFLSDVYINLDQKKRQFAGESSGFGLVLWAETKEGLFFGAEATRDSTNEENGLPIVPSELGLKAAGRLLDQIYLGGCVDQSLQSLILSLMACESGRNASQLRISAPTEHTISCLRLIKKNLGVTFDLTYTEDDENYKLVDSGRPPTLVATCFGCGIQNINLPIR